VNAVHGGRSPHFGRRAILGGTLGGAAAIALGACSSDSQPDTPAASGPPKRRTGTLRVAIASEPKALDPAVAVELNEYAALRNIYDGLTQFKPDYSDLSPALATSWSSNGDATVWTFRLRPDVEFHDGTPLTAKAVGDSIRYYVKKGNEALIGKLKSIDDSDPRRIKIALAAPNPDLDRAFTFHKVISPKLLEEKGGVARRAVGTGAFSWDSREQGHQIQLKANPGYWGDPAPHLERIQLVVTGNASTRLSGLTSGSLDLIEQVDPNDLTVLRSNKKIKLSSQPSWAEICLVFVCAGDAVTKDPRVRQAIAYGIDREAIIKSVLRGQGKVADTPIPFGAYGHHSPDVRYEYNPGKARKLLKDAGHPDGITLKMAGSSDVTVFSQVGEAMAAQLKEVGIKAEFVVEELGVLVNDVLADRPKRQAYLIHYGWNGYPMHFDTGDIFEHAKYTGKPLLDLIEAQRTTANGAERTKHLNDAQNKFMEELPHLPLYYPYQTDAFSSRVGGFTMPRDTYQPVFTQTYKR
jgi:peptide/nickel transport system substrate-binding protein